jgi:hypothetical protein
VFCVESVAANVSQGTDVNPHVPGLPPQAPTSAYQRHLAAQQQQQLAAAQAQLAQWHVAQQQLVQQQQQQLIAQQQQQQLARHQAMLLQQSASATGGPFYEHPSMYYVQQVGGASDVSQLPPELIEQYQKQLSEAMGHQQSGSGQPQHMKTTVSADAINLIYQQAAAGVGPPVSLHGWPPQAVGYNVYLRRASDGQVHIVPATESSVAHYNPSSSLSAVNDLPANDLVAESQTETVTLPSDTVSSEEVSAVGMSDDHFKVPDTPKPSSVCSF